MILDSLQDLVTVSSENPEFYGSVRIFSNSKGLSKTNIPNSVSYKRYHL